MLQDKEVFDKIILERGEPDYIYLGNNNNFAFIKWKESFELIEVSNTLIGSLKGYEKERIDYKHIYIKQYLWTKKSQSQ